MPGSAFDVVVVGGGAAGSALALSLRRHEPSLSVAVVEKTSYEEVRLGETLPPHARPLLLHLGVWDDFERGEHRPVHGTTAAWGGEVTGSNDYLLGARGPGWHLDRRAFDSLLSDAAERAGAATWRRCAAGVPGGGPGAWEVPLADGRRLRARFVVDASGPSARTARALGGENLVTDRLVAVARFFDDDGGSDPRTLVESFRGGWWYSAALPDGCRIVACLTDTDLARDMHLSDADRWSGALALTRHVARAIGGGRPAGAPVVRPVHTRRLARPCGTGWLAVGDAASTFDPLSSQGILKALRGGVFASYAIADALVKGELRALDHYAGFVGAEFAAYAAARTDYYARERRWPDAPFWRRRAPAPADPQPFAAFAATAPAPTEPVFSRPRSTDTTT